MNLAKLRGALAEKRITQRELAEKLGVSTKTINAKLNGRATFTVDEASIITKTLSLNNPATIFFDCNVDK